MQSARTCLGKHGESVKQRSQDSQERQNNCDVFAVTCAALTWRSCYSRFVLVCLGRLTCPSFRLCPGGVFWFTQCPSSLAPACQATSSNIPGGWLEGRGRLGGLGKGKGGRHVKPGIWYVAWTGQPHSHSYSASVDSPIQRTEFGRQFQGCLC